jgi:hypothetical protein
MSLVAKLADVVVLDDPGANARSPFQKREPSCHRHDDTCGKLMTRCHTDHPRARTWQFHGIEALGIHFYP